MQPKGRVVVRQLSGNQVPWGEGPAVEDCDKCDLRAETLYQIVPGKWYVCPECALKILRHDYRDSSHHS